MIRRLQAEHRVDLTLDSIGDLPDRDLARWSGEPASAASSPEALHETRLRERAELLFQESDGDVLTCRDLARRHEPPVVPSFGQLDHGAHRVFELLRDLEHDSLLQDRA